MFPQQFVRRIEFQEFIDARELLKALEEPSPASIRINRGKWGANPVNSEQVPWCTDGFYLEKRPLFTPDPLFHAGCYYPQEASSMFLEEAFHQNMSGMDRIRVLDLCGAPGGKSTHLASLIGDNGLLVANDVIRTRAHILAETLTKWGKTNVIVTQNDPVAFSRLKGYFDLVIVDAPCSGEGMFRNKETVREWSEGNTLLCADRQKRILMDVWPALKNGGLMVYSTCTFNPGENEENVKWLTEKQEAESISLDISRFKGITEIDFQGIKGFGFRPGKIKGEGFFLSVIRKSGRSEQSDHILKKRTGFILNKEDASAAIKMADFSRDNLIKTGNDIVGIGTNHDEYEFLKKNLRVIKSGTTICTVKNKDYIPSHELALSTGIRENVFAAVEVDLQEALAYLKRGSLSHQGVSKGRFIVTYKGVRLGFANNVGNRINNYYPVEWRIRMDIPDNYRDMILKW